MPKPTAELWTKLAKEFETQWNFPNCIGAIDGKHVNIRAPWNSGSQFYNYKKFFSVVLLAVADANYPFVVVDIGAYGRNSDSGILSSSRLGQSLNIHWIYHLINVCQVRQKHCHMFLLEMRLSRYMNT